MERKKLKPKLEDIKFIRIKSNEDYGYLHLLTQGLLAFPDRFKLSPEDEILSVFPSENPINGFALGAVAQNTLVGIATLTVFNDRIKLAHIGETSRMFVSEEAQGKRIGVRLLTELLSIVSKEYAGVLQIRLNVATHNESAKRLYGKFGFEHFPTEKNCIRLGDRFLDDDTMVLFTKNN